jgi:hypothetical protein
VGTSKDGRPLGYVDAGERIIKINFRESGGNSMVRIYLAQDRDQCRTLMNMVKTFGLHKVLGNSCVA